MIFYKHYETDIGTLTIGSDEDALTMVLFGALRLEGATHGRTRITDLAASEIREYLAGERREFDIPLRPHGTPFQNRVWQALLTIPYGETRSYKDIAIMAGSPKGFRAVGMANNRNPISIIIPCHRVIGADGSMTGYGGGLDIKKKLLLMEHSPVTPSASFPAVSAARPEGKCPPQSECLSSTAFQPPFS